MILTPEPWLLEQAKTAFRNHIIQDYHQGHWFLGEPKRSAYWVEAVVLRRGHILVGGDIEHVIFGAYTPPTPVNPDWRHDLVRWIGCCRDWHYIAEKATIGSGSHHVYETRSEAARADLKRLLEEEGDGREKSFKSACTEALERLDYDSVEEVSRYLFDEYGICDLDLGQCLHPRVVYCQAALAALARELGKTRPEHNDA